MPNRIAAHQYRTLAHLPFVSFAIGISTIIILVLAVVSFGVEGRTPSAVVSNAGGAGIATGLLIYFLKMRVDIGPSGSVRFVNLFRVYTFDVRSVVEIGSDKGLYLRLSSGEIITSSALGPSLLGDILGYRRAGRASKKLNDYRLLYNATDGAEAETVIDRRIRFELAVYLLASIGLFVTLAILVTL